MNAASAGLSGTALFKRLRSASISRSCFFRSSSCLFCVSSVRSCSLAELSSSLALLASLRVGEKTNNHQTAITAIAATTVTVMVRLFMSFPGSSLDVGLELLQPMAARAIGQAPSRTEADDYAVRRFATSDGRDPEAAHTREPTAVADR